VKRFWDNATLEPERNGYSIRLDGKPMRMPGGTLLQIGPAALARAIAEEWQAAGGSKGGEMSFSDTPLTRLAGTAQERIGASPDPTIDAITRYGETDLLCYRAASPSELVLRQARLWQPWLDWAALVHDAPLRVTTGISYIRQHHDSIAALRRLVSRQNIYALAGLGIAVPALGSLVLGLVQAELWGEDAEAAARRAGVRAEIDLAARFIGLTREDMA
jgi:chaperone required for assembly of F1-ATPase